MSFRLFVDSDDGLDVEPEWGMTEEDEKIEAVHRTRTGKRFHYRWGKFRRWSVPVQYVNSEFKSVVNSWWDSNAALKWMEEGGTEVYSVRIVNEEKPIGGFVKPYQDQFTGLIELETY